MTTTERQLRQQKVTGATAKPACATNEVRLPQSPPRMGHDEAENKTVLLRDGAHVVIRPIHRQDAERLVAFHAGLSRETLVARFLHSVPAVSLAQAERLARVDGDRAMAFVATAGPDHDAPILAEALYRRSDPALSAEAEIALVVADAWQGRGLGTALFHHLAAAARARGIEMFVADTLATNLRVLRMIQQTRIPVSARVAGGEVQLRLDISAQRDADKRS